MNESFDLLVVGAGPGGMAAVATASGAGLRVCLIDDNPSAGGQIWRAGITPKDSSPEAAQWMKQIQNANVETRFGWRAVAAPSPRRLRVERFGQCDDIEYSSLILATGARERFLPFPGWTLPGVYGAGGLQAFVKSGLDIRGRRVVVAGTGPLLLAVAAHLRAAGAQIVAIVEQASARQLARFSVSLLREQLEKLVEGARYALATAGVPYRTGAWVASVAGRQHVEGVTIRFGSRVLEVEADMLAIGYHLVPNTELAQFLHCALVSGYVHVDALQETSVEGIYCVGELTGIGGVDKAKLEGRIAALAAIGQSAQAALLFEKRKRERRFARNLAAAFALREELRHLATEDTFVCRCEDVPYGELVQCNSWREAKLHTRCGMGPCQGRICAPAAEFLFGWKAPVPRPPLFPVETGTLAAAGPDSQPKIGTVAS